MIWAIQDLMQPLRRTVFSLAFTSRPAYRCQPPSVRSRTFSLALPRCRPDAKIPAIPAAASSGIAQLTSRSLIKVSGPDAAKFLQGVVTSNLFNAPGPNGEVRTDVTGYYSAFLAAQGRILHDVFIYPQSTEQFLIEVDANEAERLSKHIKRYKLRAKFDVSMLSPEEAQVWHVFTSPSLRHEGLQLPENHREERMIIFPDPRAEGLGIRVVSFGSASSSSAPQFKPFKLKDQSNPGSSPLVMMDPLPIVPERAYTVHRYLLGIPEGQSELLYGASLPHESNMDVMNAIDFRKGCYVGQELTIRTEHRGVVRKRVLPCLLELAEGGEVQQAKWEFLPEGGAERIQTGASITRIGEGAEQGVKKRTNAVGKWIKGIGNVGLAIVRLEEAGVMEGAGGVGKEFAVIEGEEESDVKIKVKPFMPEWLRSKIEAKAR